MLPAYPGMSISVSFPLPLLGQGAVAAVCYADAAVIALIIEGYLVFVFGTDQPPNLNRRLCRAERLFKPEGTAQFADKTPRAL